MPLLACRVSRSYADLEGWLLSLREVSSAMIVYEHDPDEEEKGCNRVHVHFLLDDVTIDTDTLKYQIKKHLQVTTYSKSDWSFLTLVGKPKSPVTWDYITYMSKGHLAPKLVYNVTDETIGLKTSNWIKRTQGHTQYKTIKEETPDQKRRRQIDMVKECVEWLNIQPDTKFGPGLDEKIINAIQTIIVDKYDTLIGRYKYRDYYDAIYARLRPTGWKERMLGIVAFKEINNL